MLELLADTTLDLARSGARHGLGVFETIRIENGWPLRLGLHHERLSRGTEFLGLDEPPDLESLRDFLAGETPCGALDLGVLRLVAVDGSLLAWAETMDAETPVSVEAGVAGEFRRFSGSPLNRHKTLSYLENSRLAREAANQGLFELVALNEHERLTDGSRTSMLLVSGNEILTPPVADGALPGTMRELLLRAGLVREQSMGLRELREADAVILCNALRECVPVHEVRGIGPKDPDPPILARMRQAVEDNKGL